MFKHTRPLAAFVAICATLTWALASRAEDPPARPARSQEARQPGSGQTPDVSLEDVLKRLNRLEHELLDLRIKTGRVPADKNEQRVLTLVETPFLGGFQYGAPGSRRFFAARLTLVNLTEQPLTLKRGDVSLSADGQTYPVKDAPQELRFLPLQVGQQQVQLQNLRMPDEVKVPVGAAGSTWMIFPELPPGSNVPVLVLKVKLADATRDIDVNAAQREALDMKVERMGPRGVLGVITIGGALNTINVGSLVDEADRLALDKIVRLVIRFADGSSIADPQLTTWLLSAANVQPRNVQRFGDSQFPPLSATLRELHLAAMPSGNESAGMQMAYPAPNLPNPGRGAGSHVHKTDTEAIIAAVYTAYEALPRDELLQAIQSGSRLERAAALSAAGGRLLAEHLGAILKLADDGDLIVQQAALVALGHFGEKPAIDKLVEWASKDVADVSAAAVASLAGSRFSAAHEALLALLANETPEEKKRTVRVLAAYPRPIWSDAIYEFVRDSRSGLNVEALSALVQVGHPRLLSVLEEALRGKDLALAQAALGIVAGRTDRESEELALEYTLSHLKTALPTPIMLQLLNRTKDRRALPLLVAHFDKEQNKAGLISTLALLGDSDTMRFLAEKYPALQGAEKSEVLKALGQLDKPRFRKLAAQALLTGDTSVVGQAVQGLQEDGGPEALAIMIEALDTSPASFSWSHLCTALAQNGAPAARAALLRACDSGSTEKRNFALSALQLMRTRSPGYQFVVEAQGFAEKKLWQDALDRFDLALKLDPNLPDAYAERGHCLLQMEKPADAASDFAKAWELDPYSHIALTGLCLVDVLVNGKHAEGVKRLEEARSKFRRQAIFHYNAACVYGRAYEFVLKEPQSADRDALLEKYKQAAIADLKAAWDAGFQNVEHMKADPDLKALQDAPEFQEVLSRPPQADDAGRARRQGRARRGN